MLNSIQLAFSTDDNYCQHLSVALVSIIANKLPDTEIDVYILYDNLQAQNIAQLNTLATPQVRIKFVQIDKKGFANCPVPPEYHFSLPTYYRLKLADLLFDLDKILYLDCDIVVQQDLVELFNHDISDFYAAATKEYETEDFYQRLDLTRQAGFYFNSGIMLINLKKWRDEKLSNVFFDFIKNNPQKIRWVDQDVLNCCLYGKVLELKQVYNAKYFDNCKSEFMQNKFFANALKNPVIIHYLANVKPWHADSTHPLKSEYFKYLEQSPYLETHNFESTIASVSEMTASERNFVKEIIQKFQPKKIVEIGVAAGASSAIILNEIKDLKDAKLYSLDYSKEYYRDNQKLTGFLIPDSFPKLTQKWELKTGGLSCNFLEEIGGEIDLCLLDTMHSNPGEFLDFLMILPYLKKNAVVIIHDTSLCWITKYLPHTTCGTLLSAISGEKISPSRTEYQYFPNIGAAILDSNQKERIFDIFHLLTLPWAYKLADKDVADLNQFFPQHYEKKYCNLFNAAVRCNHEYLDSLAPLPTTEQVKSAKKTKTKKIKFLGITLYKKKKSRISTKYYLLGLRVWKHIRKQKC